MARVLECGELKVCLERWGSGLKAGNGEGGRGGRGGRGVCVGDGEVEGG